jgi:hypothetical protein
LQVIELSHESTTAESEKMPIAQPKITIECNGGRADTSLSDIRDDSLSPDYLENASGLAQYLEQSAYVLNIDTTRLDQQWLLRFTALCCAAIHGNPHGELSRQAIPLETVYPWILFLCNESQATFFLQEHRCKDAVFFEDPDLRPSAPKPRSQWGDIGEGDIDERTTAYQGSSGVLQEWQNCLRWLDAPTAFGSHSYRAADLTVAELELALVLFNWKEDRPRFAWWVRRWPHILHTVHLFLLRRYSWTLLAAFEEARIAEKALYPPTFDAEYTRRHEHCNGIFKPFRLLRMWGLMLLGLFTIRQVFPCPDSAWHHPLPFFASDWTQFAGACFLLCFSVAGLWLLCYKDVLKQNHGMLISFAHARPRTLRLCRSVAWRGLVTAGVFHGIGWVSFHANALVAVFRGLTGAKPTEKGMALLLQSAGGNAIFWNLATHAMGIVALGMTAAFIGVCGQWVFQDVSLTEPV